jgi:PST family polysaccharide transporter
MVGLKWNTIQQVAFQVINYGSLLVLANLVSAEDFGALALSTVLVGLFEILNGFGLGPLIIKDKIVDQRRLSTLFWLASGLSLMLFFATLVAGPFYAWFYRPSGPMGLYLVLAASALTIPINGMNAIFSAQYMRDMDFKLPSLTSTVAIVCGAVVAVGLAWGNLGIWALVAKNVVPVVVQNICFWVHGRYRVTLSYDRDFAKSTRAFSTGFSSFSFVNYFIRNLDYIVIGKFFTEGIVGQYALAYKLMLFPLKNIASRVYTVFYPVLAGVKDSAPDVSRIYFKAVGALACVAFPIMFLASVLAELWVPLLFGLKYPYLPGLVQILSIVGAFQATTSAVGVLFLISGRTDSMFKTSLLLLVVMGSGFIVGALSGSIYVFAWLYAALYIGVCFPVSNVIPFRLTGLRMHSLFRALAPPLTAALFASASAWLLVRLTVSTPVVTRLAIALLGATATYLIIFQTLSRRSSRANLAYCWQLLREATH